MWVGVSTGRRTARARRRPPRPGFEGAEALEDLGRAGRRPAPWGTAGRGASRRGGRTGPRRAPCRRRVLGDRQRGHGVSVASTAPATARQKSRSRREDVPPSTRCRGRCALRVARSSDDGVHDRAHLLTVRRLAPRRCIRRCAGHHATDALHPAVVHDLLPVVCSGVVHRRSGGDLGLAGAAARTLPRDGLALDEYSPPQTPHGSRRSRAPARRMSPGPGRSGRAPWRTRRPGVGEPQLGVVLAAGDPLTVDDGRRAGRAGRSPAWGCHLRSSSAGCGAGGTRWAVRVAPLARGGHLCWSSRGGGLGPVPRVGAYEKGRGSLGDPRPRGGGYLGVRQVAPRGVGRRIPWTGRWRCRGRP